MNNTKYLNNNSIAEQLFDNIVLWSASKNPTKTRYQLIAEIEKILDSVEDRHNFYKKGYMDGMRDAKNDIKVCQCT